MAQKNLFDQVERARDVGVPIVAITTLDPGRTMAALAKGFGDDTPKIRWDVASGFIAYNDNASKAAIMRLVDTESDPEADPSQIKSAPGALMAMAGVKTRRGMQYLPSGTVVFMLGMDRWLTANNDANTHACVQALWNLRDQFKQDGRTVILLVPSIQLPQDLTQDVTVIDEPLPSRDEIEQIIRDLVEGNEAPLPSAEDMDRAVDALKGLSAFSVESAIARSLYAEGLDLESLWDNKRKIIRQTPGISIYEGTESFDTIGGYDRVKDILLKYVNGKRPVRVVVFIDEIDKGLAGTQGDNTGISQDQHGQMLEFMEDKKARGMLFVGPPGSGKSQVAKAFGNSADVLTIKLDLGGMKDKYAGNSEARIRAAFKVIDAISDGGAFFLATCNRMGTLSPEIKRRFRAGTYFFELPQRAEREAIWPLYMKGTLDGISYEIPAEQLTDAILDMPLTGAEIRNACEAAAELDITLAEAVQTIVPVAVSGKQDLQNIRSEADGTYLSASHPGVYSIDEAETVRAGVSSAVMTAASGTKRGIRLPSRSAAPEKAAS